MKNNEEIIKQDWEKEVYDRFSFAGSDIKDFIGQLLAARDSHWLKKIEEGLGNELKIVEEKTFYHRGYENGWNNCRLEIKQKLLK